MKNTKTKRENVIITGLFMKLIRRENTRGKEKCKFNSAS
jgi:hypothetical protein